MFLSTSIPQKSSEIIFASPLARALRFSKNFRRELASNDLYELARTEIAAITSYKKIDVLSFDVFDTALIRSPQSEAKRFYEVSKAFSVGKDFTAEDAFISRISAAKTAYALTNAAHDGTREGQFYTIASLVCDQLQVPELTEQYLNLELAYEASTLAPNPLIKKIIQDHEHLRIIFISDMYFSSTLISDMLLDSYGKVEIYSSADGNGSKRAGGLFNHVSQCSGVAIEHFLHFGDSLEGDFRAIRKNGGNSIYLPLPDAERKTREACYSALVEQLSYSNFNLSSHLSFNC